MMSERETFLLDGYATPFYRRALISLCYWSSAAVHWLAIGDLR